MHAIKGGWVGQTFALSKCNESEGKKTRIRRSKEERKAMVESFIKKYQSSNNGNFPSLNLTHKEVGGSFYTVREIVREIIQENRVLGPAKFASEELITVQPDEQFPLGSISIEPQTVLHVTSNESHFAPNNYHVSSEDSIFDGVCSNPDKNQGLETEQIINGSDVDLRIDESSEQSVRIEESFEQIVRIEESTEKTYENLQTSNPSKTGERDEKLVTSTNEVIQIMDVGVEIFPVRLAREVVRNQAETLEGNEIDKVELDPASGSVLLDKMKSLDNSGLMDEGKEETDLNQDASQFSDRNFNLVEKEVVEDVEDRRFENCNCSIINEGTVLNTPVGPDIEVEVSRNSVLTSEVHEQKQRIEITKAINSLNGKNPNSIPGISSSSRESRTPEAGVNESKAIVQHEEKFERESNPVLDRINLESWEGASKNSAEREINPVWAVLKSCVTAFIKFWTE